VKRNPTKEYRRRAGSLTSPTYHVLLGERAIPPKTDSREINMNRNPKAHKFDQQKDAVQYARARSNREPAYDWYVIHSPDGPSWYVERGGDYPKLFNGSQVVWINGAWTRSEIKYVYLKSEPGLFTVGFYGPGSKWTPESDHSSPVDAASRCAYLNGYNPNTPQSQTE
jgi:hypothetical protein